MKRLRYLVGAFLVITLVFGGCDSLNVSPESQISEKDVWSDPALIRSFVSNIYRGMGHGAAQGKLSALTSNASSIPDLGASVIVQATLEPGSQGLFTMGRGDLFHFHWPFIYDRIRNANVVLANIEGSEVGDQQFRDMMKGEAHFLRAYFYHNLLRMYGGVPIHTEPAQLGDEDLAKPRSSFSETVDFIVQEADQAASLLPTVRSGNDVGRASGGAAMALKSRVLLYAASDLYHENPSGMAETGYTSSQNRMQMWRDAKNAAEAVMDLGEYSLFRPNPANDEEAAENYYQLSITPKTNEAIFERFFSTDDAGRSNFEPNQDHGPNGYHQWGGNTPTQQLVDAYRMSDGSEFSWDNSDNASDPYANRDPRFYGTVLYDGAPWRERPDDAEQFDEDNVVQTFAELELPNGNKVAGVDTRESPIESWNGTKSGYYMKKFVQKISPRNRPQAPDSWIYFRLGEILLNYAEASIELGEYSDAREALNQLRRRAHMPEFESSLTGQDLMEAYRNERRVELVFEEHRFFDIRRWMIAPQTMSQDAKGINVSADGQSQADRDSYNNFEFEVDTYMDRNWDDKMYFKPIPEDEMNRSEELVQNPGYSGG